MEVQDILNDPALLDQIVTDIFNQFDADKSGGISQSELREAVNQCLSSTGKGVTDAEVDEAMKALDSNKDGTISKSEFSQLVVQILNEMA